MTTFVSERWKQPSCGRRSRRGSRTGTSCGRSCWPVEADRKSAMVPLAADNDLHGASVRGLRRCGVDLVRLVDVGMADRPDDEVLEWAAGEGRVLVTQDVQTMI